MCMEDMGKVVVLFAEMVRGAGPARARGRSTLDILGCQNVQLASAQAPRLAWLTTHLPA